MSNKKFGFLSHTRNFEAKRNYNSSFELLRGKYFTKIVFLIPHVVLFHLCRMVACEWFIFTFLITSSYSGNLRAFLLKPDLSPPIELLSDIVNSGIPWKVVMYGDLAQSWSSTLMHNDAYRRYWEGKIPLKFTDFPFEVVKAPVLERTMQHPSFCYFFPR